MNFIQTGILLFFIYFFYLPIYTYLSSLQLQTIPTRTCNLLHTYSLFTFPEKTIPIYTTIYYYHVPNITYSIFIVIYHHQICFVFIKPPYSSNYYIFLFLFIGNYLSSLQLQTAFLYYLSILIYLYFYSTPYYIFINTLLLIIHSLYTTHYLHCIYYILSMFFTLLFCCFLQLLLFFFLYSSLSSYFLKSPVLAAAPDNSPHLLFSYLSIFYGILSCVIYIYSYPFYYGTF